ncbi:glycosyltransferase family 4 protein [Pedococcus ginsenosidimutans]|uniref:D-inositol 3-phosphate glycosyltransferase n=1 Tax=Pedococcus ginsenosidimutans TaxID=490570 RepID=A0ABP8YDJ1_9MICO
MNSQGNEARVTGGDHIAWSPLHIAMVGQKGLPATFGGIEHHVENIGARLVERGHRVTVYCRSTYSDAPMGEHRGMRLVAAPTIGTKHLDAIVHSATSTGKALAAGVDVVHYHGIGPGLVAPVPRFLSRSSVVMTVHGLDHQRAKWGAAAQAVLGAAHWMSGRVPDELVVVSRDLVDHYRDRPGLDATYVPNGVVPHPPVPADLLDRFGLQPGRYAVSVGRLVPEKRADLLIRAFRRVEGDHRLAIVGDSSFSDDFSRHLRDLAADDPRVVFTGFAFGDDLAALYQHAGVFVQPSALEGLPLTLLEAVSYDCPVLVSDIPPHLEVVGQGSSRHRTVPVDDLEALAVALDQMLRAERTPDPVADELRSGVVSHYSWDTAVLELEQVYLRSLARHRGSPGRHHGPLPGTRRADDIVLQKGSR